MNEIPFFNLNDFTVLMCGFLALLLTVLLAYSREHIKNLFLAAFFFQSALYAADTLLYWNVTIKAAVAAVSPNFFFVLGFSLFLQGPLLLWFTKATVYRHFKLRKYDLLHLLPALLYPLIIYALYFRLDDAQKLVYITDWSAVTANPWFDSLIWAQRLSAFVYSLLCVRLLYQYIFYLKSADILISKVDIQWLKLLQVGFLIINSWGVLELLESRILDFGLASPLGIAESYIRFAIMISLVVYLLRNSKGFTNIQVEHAIAEPDDDHDPHQDVLERLTQFMMSHKPYLEPNMTLDRLAARLDVSPKLLSATINRKLNQNFFELIRHYRVEEAKAQLLDARHRNRSISEIMKDCGFNSKSVFNQAFKQAIGVTPSRFRQQHLGH